MHFVEPLLDRPAYLLLLFVVFAARCVCPAHDALHVVLPVAHIMPVGHLWVFGSHAEVAGGELDGGSPVAVGVLQEHGVLEGSISVHNRFKI